MNRFHSSGTPRAKVEVMWTWNRTIAITAMVPIVPPSLTSRTKGQPNSQAVPRWAANSAWREGRTSFGQSLQSIAFILRERFQGVLLTITEIT